MADEAETMKMKILKDCFVSDKTRIIRDGQNVERRKVFAGEVMELHIDDAILLDEKNLASQVMERKPVVSAKAAKDDPKIPA